MAKKSAVTKTTYRCWYNSNDDIPADCTMTELEMFAKTFGETPMSEKYAVVYDDTYNDVYEVHVFDNRDSAAAFLSHVAWNEWQKAIAKYGEDAVWFEYFIDFTYAYISDLSKDWEIELSVTKVIAH